MVTFNSLFNFFNLSNGQLKLSSPLDSFNLNESNEEDAWYNIPFNLKDKDDDSIASSFTLPLRPLITFIAFIILDIIRKEHFTSVKIKECANIERIGDRVRD
jgi:hypothetical protein